VNFFGIFGILMDFSLLQYLKWNVLNFSAKTSLHNKLFENALEWIVLSLLIGV